MPTYATTTTTIAPFNLSAKPDTDIWRKPPTHDVFTAPTHPSSLPKFSLQSFQRARLTFTLPPISKLTQYDQAGLVLVLTKEGEKEKWIKTGIEFYNGKPYLSTVGTDRWSDWSVAPVELTGDGDDARPSATIEAKRERDQLGKSLWVYQIVKDGEGNEIERRPLREMNWVFAEEEGWEIAVGGMVARPAKEDGVGELEAEFKEGVQIEVLDYEKQV